MFIFMVQFKLLLLCKVQIHDACFPSILFKSSKEVQVRKYKSKGYYAIYFIFIPLSFVVPSFDRIQNVQSGSNFQF